METDKPNLYIIVHCQSRFNKRHIFTGRINSHLTTHGIGHAKEIGEELKNVKLDLAIITSLSRTAETLKHIIKYHPGCKVEVDDRIIERDYGELSGLNKDKYARENPDLYPVYHRSYDVPPPGGESIKDVEARVLPFLTELISRMKKEKINVLIVCHGNSIRPMIRHFEHLTIDEMMKLEHLPNNIYNLIGSETEPQHLPHKIYHFKID